MHGQEMHSAPDYQFDKKRIALESRKEGEPVDYQFDKLKKLDIYSLI